MDAYSDAIDAQCRTYFRSQGPTLGERIACPELRAYLGPKGSGSQEHELRPTYGSCVRGMSLAGFKPILLQCLRMSLRFSLVGRTARIEATVRVSARLVSQA
jgi:hypothetical protein